MVLGETLVDGEGVPHVMAGLLPLSTTFAERSLHLGYREVESCTDSPLLRKGQRVRGHEFHWSVLEHPGDPAQAVYRVVDQDNRPEGFLSGSGWASDIHIHLGSDPALAKKFVDTCAGGAW